MYSKHSDNLSTLITNLRTSFGSITVFPTQLLSEEKPLQTCAYQPFSMATMAQFYIRTGHCYHIKLVKSY